MGKRCAVPGCLTGDPADVKRRKFDNEKQVRLFGVPKCPQLANAWTTAVKATSPLKGKDHVCQFHFRDNDVITHFLHTCSNGDVVSIERERYALRKGAVPIAGQIMKLPLPAENLNIKKDPFAETSSESRARQRRDTCSRVSTSQPADHCSSSRPDKSFEETNVIHFDDNSDEKILHNAESYSIEKLIDDLRASQWKQCWAWDRNADGIVFIHLSPPMLTPRLYYSINNDLSDALSPPDKKCCINIHDKIRNFLDVSAMLTALERTKVCTGTGLEEESRSKTCCIVDGESEMYRRQKNSERCSDCRDLRHKLQRRAKRRKVTVEAKHSKVKTALRLLQKRHKTLQQKVSIIKRKMIVAQNECGKRKESVIREAISSLPPEQQESVQMFLMSTKVKKPQGRK